MRTPTVGEVLVLCAGGEPYGLRVDDRPGVVVEAAPQDCPLPPGFLEADAARLVLRLEDAS